MNDVIFSIKDGQAYFKSKGYSRKECMAVVNGLVDAINKSQIIDEPISKDNIISYEDILDKRVVAGDSSKSTQKLKEWLDNDPDVLAEDGV